MRNFFSVFRLQWRNMFRRNRAEKSKRSWGGVVLLAVLYAAIVPLFVYLIAKLGKSFVVFSLQSEFVALILLAGLLVELIFGIVTVLTCLYFSRDTEFFLSLPVKPSTVYAAKIAVVYAVELAVTALLLTPCLIAAGVAMHMGALFYVLMVPAVFFTPAIPLFLASIISIPIMYAVSFFRNRGALGSILVLVLFGAFFALYYFGINKMQDIDAETVDLSGIQRPFRNIARTAYPLYAMARAMTGAHVFGLSKAVSVAVNILICVGILAAFAVAAWAISAAVYRKGAAAQLEGATRHKTSAAAYHGTGTVRALMKKEWREILRTPSFALNCLLGVVLCPIVVAFVAASIDIPSIIGTAANEGEALSQHTLNIIHAIARFSMLWMVLFLGVGTNSAAFTAFSREGEKFAYCKLLPVDTVTQVRAKSYVYLIVSCIAALLGLTVMSVLQFDAAFSACALALSLLFVYASVQWGIYVDLRSPKLKWNTPNEVMKHNKNVLIGSFGSMFASLLLAGGACGLFVLFYRSVSRAAAMAAAWSIVFALTLAMAIAGHVLLYRNCDKLLNEIES